MRSSMAQQLADRDNLRRSEIEQDVLESEQASRQHALATTIEQEQTRARKEYLTHLMDENRRVCGGVYYCCIRVSFC